jgi:hypothetical protein
MRNSLMYYNQTYVYSVYIFRMIITHRRIANDYVRDLTATSCLKSQEKMYKF